MRIDDISLLDLVKRAFSPEVLGSINLSQRKVQYDFVTHMAAQWDKQNVVDHVINGLPVDRQIIHIDGGSDSSKLPYIDLLQAGTGIGKTVAYLVLLIFANIKSGNKLHALVATHSINLRKQLIGNDLELARKIVNQTLALNNIESDFNGDDTTVNERLSYTSYASLSKAVELKDDHPYYYETVYGFYAVGVIPEIAEIIDIIGEIPEYLQGDNNHLGLTENEFYLKETSPDKVVDGIDLAPLIADIQYHIRETPNNSHIVAVTQSMLLLNNIQYCKPLGNIEGYNICIVDEADQLPEVAKGILNKSIDLRNIKLNLPVVRFRKDSQCKVTYNKLVSEFDDLFDFVKSAKDSTTDKYFRFVQNTEQQFLGLKIRLASLLKSSENFSDIYVRNKHEFDKSKFNVEIALKGIRELWYMVMAVDRPERILGMANSQTDAYIAVNESLCLVQQASNTPKIIINRLWRSSLYNFSNVTLMSATLSGYRLSQNNQNDYFNTFAENIGINPEYDHISSKKEFIDPSYGRISKMIIAGRKSPTPCYFNKPSDVKIDFVKFVSDHINSQFKNRNERVLCLFPSIDLKLSVMKDIEQRYPTLFKRLMIKKQGTTFTTNISRIIEKDDVIWFGHEWCGANFVSDGETLFKNIVVTRIPIAPITEIAPKPYEWPKNIENGLRNLIQGIGRGLRKATDEVEVHILDNRVVPDEKDTKKSPWNIPEYLRNKLSRLAYGKEICISGIPNHLLKNTIIQYVL